MQNGRKIRRSKGNSIRLNMITGYADGAFKPENSVTRAEFASMIARFAGLDNANRDTAFTDISGHWAYGHIMEGAVFHKIGD